MKITAIKTEKVTSGQRDLLKVIDNSVRTLEEGSILVITSKIVAITEGRVIAKDENLKEELIHQEADYYLPRSSNQYAVTLTIKNNILIPTAGIDESNIDGHYVLWPQNPQETANQVRQQLRTKHRLTKLGVIITDSKTTPLRRGTTGIALAHSGFLPLKNYIGQPDIFGTPMKMTQASIVDGLAAAAVLAMGEGDEQTPLAIIKEIDLIQFQESNPTPTELKELQIDLEDDLYAPLLGSVTWLKGGKRERG